MKGRGIIGITSPRLHFSVIVHPRSLTCCSSTSPPTTWTWTPSSGWRGT